MKIVFDLETVRKYEKLSLADEKYKAAWEYTCKSRYPETDPEEAYEKHAGLHPEFGTIICMCAIDSVSKKMATFRIDHPAGELGMLKSIHAYLEKLTAEHGAIPVLVGHRIKSFDIPYLITRMLANDLKIPAVLQQNGRKPWEKNVIDTYDAWKGGEYQTTQAASLVAICMVLGIPTPKDDIDGSQVADVFFGPDPFRVDRICKYCENDTQATAQIFNQMILRGVF